MFHLRRLVTALLVLTLVIPTGASAATSPQASQKARLVKAKGFGTVYVVAEGQKLRVPNKAFKTGKLKKKDVKIITSKELKKIPTARFVQAEEGGKVYAVNVSGSKTAIANESAIVQSTASTVVELPSVMMEAFEDIAVTETTPIVGVTTVPAIPGTLVEVPYTESKLRINNKGQVLNYDEQIKILSAKFPQYSFSPHAMNDNGQIVGTVRVKNADGDEHPFVIDNGKFQLIGGPNFLGSAFDINNKGQVVGYQMGRGGSWQKAFLWENGKITYLGTLGGDSAFASMINNNGQIVGQSSLVPEGGSVYSFIWENGKMTNLGSLGGRWTTVSDINDKGQIIGIAEVAPDEEHEDFYSEGFIWKNGIMKKMGHFTPGLINNNGQMLGGYPWKSLQTEQWYSPPTSAIWQDGEIMSLHKIIYPNEKLDKHGRHPQPQMSPIDFNDNGQILGYVDNKPYVFTMPINTTPQLRFLAPYMNVPNDGTPNAVQIDWQDADIDSNATISLYLDVLPPDESDLFEAGTEENMAALPIVTGLKQDGADTYLFDRSQFPKGRLSIYAIIDDGINPPQKIRITDFD